MTEIKKEVIEAYALENATKHNGKASPNSVLAGLFAEGLEKSEIKNYMPKIQEAVHKINSLSLEEQEKQLEKSSNLTSKREVREGLPELPNAEKGKVVTRIAPFPSGPLHIGNTRPLVLNDEYAKIYEGKFLLVLDDTIGSEKKMIEPAAYDLIIEGVKWLGCNIHKILYKSERIETYYKYAEELIKKGYMYVCSCDAEEFRELKLKKQECPCRNLSPEIQLKRWNEMMKKSSTKGSYVVRLKTSMKDPDPAFRDRVMFKITDLSHPKLGEKYHVYPSMDFSWAIDNHTFGVTHILRGVDLVIEGRVENFIRDIFGWENPEVIYNGFLELEGVKISKSKGAKEVKSGQYIGWNDPRLWSLQSLRDRGIHPEAIREFMISQGVRRSNTKVPIDVLYNFNKKYLDKASKYFFVESPVKIKINGCPHMETEIQTSSTESRTYKTGKESNNPEKDTEKKEKEKRKTKK